MATRTVAPAVFAPDPASLAWLADLAEPYLRGYPPRPERLASLTGYRFFAPGSRGARPGPARRGAPAAGFFAGYLLSRAGSEYLRPMPPECLVFWFVEPVKGPLHRRLVAAPGSLARGTTEYVRWLTHRPPRFESYDDAPAVLVRHGSMAEWPAGKIEHFSRNFFIETFALLVRSGLVRRLPEAMQPTRRG